ncbi:1-deoxy-D-xylulose-5-phosphate synthase [Pullulanibacillus sp. KACC 23026]|uniref:1-deoxy-D-xylulose-5-phosphate synthase n=1 Tax=Pullulanibacillus sp. KACC 23026 TaxID=3028315 RepID=UPI0023B131A6|nr:1-deoxy-D-xylulose-5-phosphate synthase [Pullulanibacillus sp. KACC 23026]WEG14322.1 1-deoxy-D-xylulose-5-phosphate synthase [Pullulanibacillus sp. KACC 23026]
MELTEIQDPRFLKKMDKQELEALAKQIRMFLIEKLAVTGGHLAPNLGVVELTLALHKLFNSPKDKLIWDVGHQSYVHKILTGRASQFETLRQYKGLCGFPKRSESPHDVWETGHSSTSLSAAMGMAAARDIKGTDEKIIAIIGDGALTGGMALEALNHIGHEKKDIIIVLNDNEMSIAPNVGALHNMLGRLRTAGRYQKVKDDIEYLMKKIPAFGGKIAGAAERVKDTLKYLVVSGIFFEELGITYLGPVDGHNLDNLIENLNYAKKTKGPVLVHVLTQKGKGYYPAESDAVGTWHGTGPYKIESGDLIKPVDAPPSYSKVVGDTLTRLGKEEERLVVITPAMKVGSKLESFASQFPNRFFDVGIAEQHAATMAAGLATQGMKPVLSIYSTFMQRAYDQLIHDICRQNLNVVIAVDRSGLVGADGETHQGVFDVAFLRSIPNIKILMGKDENELQHLIYTALKQDGPVAVRLPRGNGVGVEMDKDLKLLPIGKWEVLKEGKDAVILSYGPSLENALEAHEQLLKKGISVEVINARSIKPMDEEMLKILAKRHLPIVIFEEAVEKGSFGSGVLEFYSQHGEHHVEIEIMGIPDRFIEHGSVSKLLQEIHLTTEDLVEKIKALVPVNEKQRAYLR